MNDHLPKTFSRRQEAQRAKMLGSIREARQKFLKDFPEGCRVEFRRPPATVDNPTIRIGKATILKVWSTYGERFTHVRYRLDSDPQDHRGRHECQIQTFLRDNPVRIEEEP
jgi:hypothetical protein